MLIQLLYLSVSHISPESMTLESEIAEILSASYMNNERDGVTGLLLYAGGYYCQLLEGEAEAVDRVYARIERDPRHQDLRVLFRRPTDWVFLPNFPMGCAGIEREPDGLIADAQHLRGWSDISEAAPVVLYSLLSRVPETDLVLHDPNRLFTDQLTM